MDEIRSLFKGLRLGFVMTMLHYLSGFEDIPCVTVRFTHDEAEELWRVVAEECEMIELDPSGPRWLCGLYFSLYLKLTLLCNQHSDASVMAITPDEAWELLELVIPEDSEVSYGPRAVALYVSICAKLKLALNKNGFSVNVTLLEFVLL